MVLVGRMIFDGHQKPHRKAQSREEREKQISGSKIAALLPGLIRYWRAPIAQV